jgi:hypothetical protein
MSLINKPNLKNFELAINQVQGNVGLTNMSDSKNLDLVVSQVQGNVSLANMSDPRTKSKET